MTDPRTQPHVAWERFAVRTPHGMLKGMTGEDVQALAELTGGEPLRSTAVYVTSGPHTGLMQLLPWRRFE